MSMELIIVLGMIAVPISFVVIIFGFDFLMNIADRKLVKQIKSLIAGKVNEALRKLFKLK